MLGTEWNDETEFSKKSPESVQPCGACCKPCRTESVKCRQGMVGDGFDGNGFDVLVAMGFEEAARLKAIFC